MLTRHEGEIELNGLIDLPAGVAEMLRTNPDIVFPGRYANVSQATHTSERAQGND